MSLVTTRVFGDETEAVSAVEYGAVVLAVATLERAAFEMMYLVPERQSYEEALQVMESLTALRPTRLATVAGELQPGKGEAPLHAHGRTLRSPMA